MPAAFGFAFWMVVLTILATFAAAVLSLLTYLLVRKSPNRRARAIIAAFVYPYGCVMFAAVWFFIYAAIITSDFDRDMGMGDSWQTPLPNGCVLQMIDTTDHGFISYQSSQQSAGGFASQNGGVDDVRKLQVAGRYLFGVKNSQPVTQPAQPPTASDQYFELDVPTRAYMQFSSLADLQKEAARHNVTLNLRPIVDVYADYYGTWFGDIAQALLLIVPLIGFIVLAIYVWKVRRTQVAAKIA